MYKIKNNSISKNKSNFKNKIQIKQVHKIHIEKLEKKSKELTKE